MTKQEAMRQTHQENALLELGFTREEAEQLRRISMRLQRWHERECGTDNGCIERDEATNKTYWLNSYTGRRYPIPDLETGARKRLSAIIAARNKRDAVEKATDSVLDKRGAITAYIQGDPRGAALYILRPGDVPDGQDVNSYYTRGICVY